MFCLCRAFGLSAADQHVRYAMLTSWVLTFVVSRVTSSDPPLLLCWQAVTDSVGMEISSSRQLAFLLSHVLWSQVLGHADVAAV